MLLGPDLLPFGLMGERLRNVLATFPSSYQILPTYVCSTDQNGQKFNILEDETWLAEEQRPLLRNAYEFRRELGMKTSIPTVSIFGYGLKKTVTDLQMHHTSQGGWQKLSFNVTQAVPAPSLKTAPCWADQRSTRCSSTTARYMWIPT